MKPWKRRKQAPPRHHGTISQAILIFDTVVRTENLTKLIVKMLS
jgi:hypothetical protein